MSQLEYKKIKERVGEIEPLRAQIDFLEKLEKLVIDRTHDNKIGIKIDTETFVVDDYFLLDEIVRQKAELEKEADKLEKKIKLL